jgi:hypothetical protein
LLFILAIFAAAYAPLATAARAYLSVPAGEGADASREFAPVATADRQAIFAQAQAWPAHGVPFPDAVLRQAVEIALRPEAPEDQVTAAIKAFDLYQDRPWVPQVLQPFVVYHATHIVLNADVFARLHCGWTKRAVAMAVPQIPGLVLSVLKILSTIDPVWAKQLTMTVVATTPALVWSHVDALIAVDAQWAESLLRDAAKVTPYHALYAVRSYSATPWGAQFFADLVLQEPRWVVNVVTSGAEQYDAVRQVRDAALHPAVQALAQLAQSDYPRETKERMAVFVEALAAHTLSLEEAAHLSSDTPTYFRTLVALRLRDAAGEHHAIASTLAEEASTLASEINSLLEQPAAIQFHVVESLAAREIYLMLTYGEAEMFTSSYRGIFDRLLTRMRQEGLTGDELLADVHHLHFRVFIKSAAVFNRLTMFLATIPSPVARWSLLTRCMSDLERATDVTVQAVTAAEILSAPLDRDSLRLIRDTLRSEYTRAEMEHSQHGHIIYGLLIAALTQRHASELADPALMTLAASYLPALPDLTGIPMATLFPNGVSLHRYFFYNDADGQQSFASFMAHYRHDPAWHIEDHGSFVHLRSHGPGRQIEIYANTFTDDD